MYLVKILFTYARVELIANTVDCLKVSHDDTNLASAVLLKLSSILNCVALDVVVFVPPIAITSRSGNWSVQHCRITLLDPFVLYFALFHV